MCTRALRTHDRNERIDMPYDRNASHENSRHDDRKPTRSEIELRTVWPRQAPLRFA